MIPNIQYSPKIDNFFWLSSIYIRTQLRDTKYLIQPKS